MELLLLFQNTLHDFWTRAVRVSASSCFPTRQPIELLLESYFRTFSEIAERVRLLRARVQSSQELALRRYR